MGKRQWSDLNRRQQGSVRAAAVVQFALAATAWIDLATRPDDEVNGRKVLWALAIGVNYVGPIAYFLKGRRRP